MSMKSSIRPNVQPQLHCHKHSAGHANPFRVQVRLTSPNGLTVLAMGVWSAAGVVAILTSVCLAGAARVLGLDRSEQKNVRVVQVQGQRCDGTPFLMSKDDY